MINKSKKTKKKRKPFLNERLKMYKKINSIYFCLENFGAVKILQ